MHWSLPQTTPPLTVSSTTWVTLFLLWTGCSDTLPSPELGTALYHAGSYLPPSERAATSFSIPEGEAPLLSIRRELNQSLWGTDGLPTPVSPLRIRVDVTHLLFDRLAGMARVDQIELRVGSPPLSSFVWHLHPLEPNGRLLLYHQGHGGTPALGIRTMSVFLEQGWSVMAFAMPALGENAGQSVPLPSGETVTFSSHEDCATFESQGIHCLVYFIEPVIQAIDYGLEAFDYSRIDMIGFSGGGWTTHLCAAIDPRIQGSFPVAGSLPSHLRTQPGDAGDWEQLPDREIYSIANYLELYALGALGEGRYQWQVLNAFDPCCFATDGREGEIAAYDQAVNLALESAPGDGFAVFIDPTHDDHAISSAAVDFLLSTLSTE